MEHATNVRQRILAAVLAMGLVLCACNKAQTTPVRIGVYDSRAIAIAAVGTKLYNEWLGAWEAEYQKARAAGDQQRVAELEAEGAARQKRLHMQAFSTAPVDDFLALIKDHLPEIKQNAGVTMLVSKWDTETLAKYSSAEQVDVTMVLVDAFEPNAGQRQTAVDIQAQQPISLEEAEEIQDW